MSSDDQAPPKSGANGGDRYERRFPTGRNSVTTFFRDAGAFNSLAALVIPRLFDEKGAADSVRVWVPGCATGEEAYTIAILLMEERDRRDVQPEIQLFASDIDDAALAFAREGHYPSAIDADMSEARLRRFFTQEANHYRVKQELREIVLFSRHSLLRDSPFSRLDLISCRNLLISLGPDIQQQVCLTFHFALLPGGYLLLGSSESADSPSGLFRVIDRDARIFQRSSSPANGARVTQALTVDGTADFEASAPEDQIRELQQELHFTQSQLRRSREEYEGAIEELRAANEELLSERRRAEHALRQGEARLRAVIDGVADAIVMIDETGVIQAVNKSADAMFGYTAEELLGANVSTLMPQPDRSRHDDYIENYLRTGVAKIIGVAREVEVARKDGSKLPAELRVSEVHHHDERSFIGFIRDLTEKRTLEVRLRRLHGDRLASMADMATALAHELNQPLSAAANYMEAAQRLLEARPECSPQVGEALDSAASQMLRAGRIVSHLHDFISRGDPEKILQSLHAIIHRTCEFAGPLIKEHKVELILHLDADRDWVLADRLQIQQVLVNLIRNACEAMGASKIRRLTITTTLKDETLRIDVIDTGVGLSKAVDADFFEPFASSKSNGLGVGLSISRSIVEAHQGKIWADPDAGGGARFSFTLPLAEMAAAEE